MYQIPPSRDRFSCSFDTVKMKKITDLLPSLKLTYFGLEVDLDILSGKTSDRMSYQPTSY